MKKIDRIGSVFNRLTIIAYTNLEDTKAKKRVACLCSCGNILETEEWSLVCGNTKSCGCLKTELNKAKGDGRTFDPLYRVYYSMIGRCYNEKELNFHNYGGRGIKVCDEWLNSFDKFRDWAKANGWQKKLQIDRRENDGNYEPSNCRITTVKENCNNKRNTIIVTFNSQTKPLTEWAVTLGIKESTLRSRLQERKLPIDTAFSTKKLYKGFVNRKVA